MEQTEKESTMKLTLLNTNASNTKILKSQNGTEFKIASLSLYPNNIICAGSKSAGCLKICLKDSGFAQIFKNVNESRKRKTDFYLNNSAAFFEQLRNEIFKFERKTIDEGYKPAFRLNTISDINYTMSGEPIPAEFPKSTFYDYTKIVKTLETGIKNYKKIFSYSGRSQYQKSVEIALKTDIPIAVVFRGFIPVGNTFLNREIIDGDKSDLKNAFNSRNKICGLKLKGNKQKTMIGDFIVEPEQAKSLELAA